MQLSALNTYNKYMEQPELYRLINEQGLKIRENGQICFRSGMDASADPIVNKHISDLIREWFEWNEEQRISKMTPIELSLEQENFPLTPDDSIKDMAYIELEGEELQVFINKMRQIRSDYIEEEYG